ncbi:MAG: hypothetical protein U0K48_05845 [Bacilli bacterium]|nr:hypothetical protein [Bacilli bacterium]
MKLFSKKNNLVVKENEIQAIKVRDLKEYLVKDFEEIKTKEQTIDKLESEIDELKKIEIKYNATLITLEEFNARVLREKDKNVRLEQKITEKNKEIAQLNEEKNNCLIREKIAIDKIENTKDFIIPEFKEKIKKVIDNTKGNLSKKKVIELINNIE